MLCWSGCYRAGSCWILAELRFLGSSGLAVLVGLHYQMATAVRPDMLRLVGLRPTVTRILTLTGVLAQFDGTTMSREPRLRGRAGMQSAVASALTASRGPSAMRVTQRFFQSIFGGRDGSVLSCAIDAATLDRRPLARPASAGFA